MGPPEEGLSGFEAGRCVLPRRTRWASIERFVTCPGALFAGRHRCLTSLAVYGGVEGLLGRMRLDGGEGGRYGCMLEIAHNDEDMKSPPS